MPTGKKIPTIESKALSIAIKRAMAVRELKTPALAEESGVPYGTLRRILELNTVANYEQLRRIAEALRMPLSEIIEDAEKLAEDPDVIADYQEETGTVADSPAVDTTKQDLADAADAVTDLKAGMDMAAKRGDTAAEQEGYEEQA